MLVSFIALVSFLLGLLVPRDIAPLRSLSVWLMRNSDNGKLAITIVGSAFVALVLVLLLSGCTTTSGGSAAKVTLWNPLTWFSGSAGRESDRAANAEVKAKADAIKAAQKTAHETSQALAAAPDSRPVEVARESAQTTVSLLDQAAGPLTASEVAVIKSQVTNLLSENAKLREEGEKMRLSARENIAELSDKLAKAQARADAATTDLKAAFARENEMANTLRNQRFMLVAVATLAAIGYAASLYLRFAYGSIPQAVGRGLMQLRATDPKAGELATSIFDSLLNRAEQARIAKHS